ncbi:MAG: GNAT family N-acetyltransferase [Aquabacterium sp.]
MTWQRVCEPRVGCRQADNPSIATARHTDWPPTTVTFPDLAPIESARLTLREVVEGDLDDLMVFNGDPEVTRFLPYDTWRGRDDAVAWHQRMRTLAETGSARQLVLFHKAEQRVVGTLLLFKFDAASSRLEVGYVLGRAHQGQGLMREALAAAIEAAFMQWGLHRLEAEVDPANLPSNRLLLSLGFTHEGTSRQRWRAKGRRYDTCLYGLLESDIRPSAEHNT